MKLEDLVPDLQRRRHLLIGQAPARSATPETRPWDSASGRRLATKMGISHEFLMDRFDTTNLNAALTGTKGKYDMFDMDEAIDRTELLKEALIADLPIHKYDVVLCCGVRVAGLMIAPLLMHRRNLWAEWLSGLPHPGGTNRWYNNPENRRQADAFCRRLGNRVTKMSA